MDQQVGAGAMLDDIIVVARIAGKHRDAAPIFEAVAVARLDRVAMIDLEGNHLYAILLINRTVAIELGYLGHDARERQLLISDADFDVERVGPLQILD